MNDIAELTGRKVTDWKALIAAAALVSSAIYFAGGLYRDSILSAVGDLIDEHSKAATANRDQFFKDLESKAGGAIGRIADMERQCAIMQDWKARTENRLDELDRWRGNCGQSMAEVKSQIVRDMVDMTEMRARFDRIEGVVSRGQRK